MPTSSGHEILRQRRGTDPRTVSTEIDKVVADLQKKLKPGNTIE